MPDQNLRRREREPKVIRRQRGVALPEGSVYVGRPTVYGNPFVIGKDGSRARVVQLYREWMTYQPGLRERARRELRGKDLVCWCAPEACHADVLLEIANSDEWRA